MTFTEALVTRAFEMERHADGLDGMFRTAVLDHLACHSLGAHRPTAQSVKALARRMAGGNSVESLACWAAFANASTASASYVDDVDPISDAHVASTLFGVSIGAARMKDLSFHRVRWAFCAGYETVQNLAFSLGTNHWNNGWHPTATLGTFGAAVTASILLELDEHSTTRALTLATSMATGGHDQAGSSAKTVHAGLAAMRGLESVFMAREGLGGSARALDGELGYIRRHGGAQGLALSQDVLLMKHWPVYKIFPCCAYLFRPITACIELHRQGVRSGRVSRVDCHVPPRVAAFVDRPRPQTDDDRRYSIQYVVAATLASGHCRDGVFSSPIDDRLSNNVTVHSCASWAEGRLELTMADGARMVVPTLTFHGDTLHPITESDVLDKVKEYASERVALEARSTCLSAKAHDDWKRVVKYFDPIATVAQLR